jgi:hypothetical protein
MPQAQRNGTGTHPPARNRLEATVVYKICGFGPPAILPPLCRAQLAPRRFKAARARCQLLQHGRRPAIPLSGEFCAAADATPSCWLFFLPDFPLLLPFFHKFCKCHGVLASHAGLDRVLWKYRLQVGCAEPDLGFPGVGRLDFGGVSSQWFWAVLGFRRGPDLSCFWNLSEIFCGEFLVTHVVPPLVLGKELGIFGAVDVPPCFCALDALS